MAGRRAQQAAGGGDHALLRPGVDRADVHLAGAAESSRSWSPGCRNCMQASRATTRSRPTTACSGSCWPRRAATQPRANRPSNEFRSRRIPFRPIHPEEKRTMTDFQIPAAHDAELQRALRDPARRRLLLGALAAGAGSLLPWEMAGAQAVDKSSAGDRLPGGCADVGPERAVHSQHPEPVSVGVRFAAALLAAVEARTAPGEGVEVARQQGHPPRDHPARRHPVPRRHAPDDGRRPLQPGRARQGRQEAAGRRHAQHPQRHRGELADQGRDRLQPVDAGRSDLPGLSCRLRGAQGLHGEGGTGRLQRQADRRRPLSDGGTPARLAHRAGSLRQVLGRRARDQAGGVPDRAGRLGARRADRVRAGRDRHAIADARSAARWRRRPASRRRSIPSPRST